MKGLSEKEKKNAFNEVRILASIDQPNIIAYKDSFFDDSLNTLNIVMEFADDGDLEEKIKSHRKSCTYFEESDIWNIFIQ
jgi:NIMA (never in mitosis gene a)-related kinase